MKMSNKSAGTQFEREFASRLAAEGFWVHRFQDNKNGQPCDTFVSEKLTHKVEGLSSLKLWRTDIPMSEMRE